MNREQYRILCRAKRRLSNLKKRERDLERKNRDPKQQHWWDEWRDVMGQVSGLEQGLADLEAYSKAGDRS